MEQISIVILPEAAGNRLDRYLAEYLPEFTRSAVQHLCDDGMVLVNKKTARKKEILRAGDEVVVTLPPPVSLSVEAQNIPLNIVYEDEHLIVVNKPKGMVVHPAPGNNDRTLVNALLYHCGDSLSGINGIVRPGIVHRIDKDTSGLLVVAKNDTTHKGLAEQIQAHTMARCYEAVVYGRVRESGTTNAPIARHPNDRKKMCVLVGGREAITHHEVIEELKGFTHLALRLETGRTHQIRVHMAMLGHPVAGDAVYGPKKVITATSGQCLHARTLGFIHPATGEYMEYTSCLPDYFTEFLKKNK